MPESASICNFFFGENKVVQGCSIVIPMKMVNPFSKHLNHDLKMLRY